MKTKEVIKKQIKELFPKMSEKNVDKLVDEYMIYLLAEKAKTMTPEQMKKDLGEEC